MLIFTRSKNQKSWVSTWTFLGIWLNTYLQQKEIKKVKYLSSRNEETKQKKATPSCSLCGGPAQQVQTRIARGRASKESRFWENFNTISQWTKKKFENVRKAHSVRKKGQFETPGILKAIQKI